MDDWDSGSLFASMDSANGEGKGGSSPSGAGRRSRQGGGNGGSALPAGSSGRGSRQTGNAGGDSGASGVKKGASDGNVFTVTQALQLAKRDLEGLRISVEGEVSEFSDKPGYKAVYFTLSDKGGALPCLIWKNDFARNGITLRKGMLVQVTGNFSVYVQKGRMNFVARTIRPAGEGALRMQVAMLAEKLQKEGLMDPARKKPVPRYPQKVAVVTSPRGKAVHDVLRTLRRRAPQVEVYVCGVPVEGANASSSICEGLGVADASDCDLILLVRGGGSYEDLMPFNDERVARAVASCGKPVVTGIGHEPDTTIADLVSDLRCSTPTAAAEAATVDSSQLKRSLQQAEQRMSKALLNDVAYKEQRLGQLASRPLFSDPNYLLSPFSMRIDVDADKLARSIPNAIDSNKVRLEHCASSLVAASSRVVGPSAACLEADGDRLAIAASHVTGPSAIRLDSDREKLANAGTHLLDEGRRQLAVSAAKLDSLSPLAVLGRGYAIAYDEAGHVVPKARGAEPGQCLELRMDDGRLACTVDEVVLDDDGGSNGGAE